MECKEAQILVKKYISGNIDEKELAAFLEHIEHCPECYEELEINYIIYSALLQLDNNPDISYNIKKMLLDEIEESQEYIKNRKSFYKLKAALFIAAMSAVTFVLIMQFNIFLII